MKLKISDNLSLPLDFVTQTQAILAKRGVGKSYTASVQAEEMLKAKQQIVVVDPTGAWFGLKSSADGKSEGYPIVIFGGEHADVPLEESAGEIIAQSLIEHRFSAVLDLSLLRKGQVQRLMWPFLETLYRLNREPVHLFCDEADALAPQKPFGDEARLLGAMEDVVRRGRRRGIGCTLITQRPAVLNKNVLTQCEVLCALRLIHPRDIDAVMEWVNVHGDPDTAKKMTESLPSLPVGTAWFWCPSWDLFEKVQIRRRETFDSGATPKAGQTIKPPKVIAKTDIDALGEKIKATVQRAKENDPSELKRKLSELQKQLQQKPSTVAETKRVEVPVVKAALVKKVEGLMGRMEREGNRHVSVAEKLISFGDQLKQSGQQLLSEAREFRAALTRATATPPANPIVASPPPVPARLHRAAAPSVPLADGVDKPTGKILQSLLWWEGIGVHSPSVAQTAARAGYAPSGTFDTYLARAGKAGLVTRESGIIRITDEGRRVGGGSVLPPDTLSSLHTEIKTILDGPQTRIIDAIIANGGREISVEDLAAASNYAPSGTFDTYLSRLGTRGLIQRRSGMIKPTEVLYPPALV